MELVSEHEDNEFRKHITQYSDNTSKIVNHYYMLFTMKHNMFLSDRKFEGADKAQKL